MVAMIQAELGPVRMPSSADQLTVSNSFRRVLRDRRLEVWGPERERAVASAWNLVRLPPSGRPSWLRKHQRAWVFRRLGQVIVILLRSDRWGTPLQFKGSVYLESRSLAPVAWRPEYECFAPPWESADFRRRSRDRGW